MGIALLVAAALLIFGCREELKSTHQVSSAALLAFAFFASITPTLTALPTTKPPPTPTLPLLPCSFPGAVHGKLLRKGMGQLPPTQPHPPLSRSLYFHPP